MGMTHDGGPRPKLFPAAAKPCGYCKSAAALLFCRVESAFMCIPCDSKAHNASNAKHERVWMCEVCEHAPAVVTCKADAAALCVTCDRDIHSANPLASRHDRVPVVPFYDTAEYAAIKSDAGLFADGGYSWIPTSPIAAPKDAPPDLKAMELFFQDSDQFIDFDSYQISSQPYSDSVVPVQTPVKPPLPENRFEIDFTRSNINSYNNNTIFTTPSLSHSVSSSSMDVGVVPDGSSLSEISYPFGRTTIGLTGNQMDREARVLRYKEKRKNRKFEKTIRYASRKAYAETRPRIKGRFAKRTDSESDIDRIFGAGAANFIADARFGVVPSF
ncbi:hypothetical protein SASPL_112094 [Salvia splendens]|uniref:Zinc finger protein CONSTANS n=1 Tax=Salvia splendens TaxID=180675 RepID=A0A8X9A2Z4_SALSN|nr:zinc finger protein CONSTANS-LIKE 5-like [Salvia splendens]KAG6427847.1 hypothetical protein SASPL_112094 [Salvia splendens]